MQSRFCTQFVSSVRFSARGAPLARTSRKAAQGYRSDGISRPGATWAPVAQTLGNFGSLPAGRQGGLSHEG
jgi:hypothetical protein